MTITRTAKREFFICDNYIVTNSSNAQIAGSEVMDTTCEIANKALKRVLCSPTAG